MASDSKLNISETIIEAYKDEDLVRSFDFDLEKIGSHVINHLPISNIEKLGKVNHYEDLIFRMKKQNLEKSGHLKENQRLVRTLEMLSSELLKTDPEYKKIMESAEKAIDQNKILADGTISSDIQICINGVYGFLLLRLNGKKISSEDEKKVDQFGNVLSYLSFKHRELTESN